MTYNSKADFISTKGLLIAERIGLWRSREQYLEIPVWVKHKMLVSDTGDPLAWIDKAMAMRTHMLLEYPDSLKIELYYWIETAEDILYRLNYKSINRFIRDAVDPRLPTFLGGYGLILHKEATAIPYGKVTKMHLRVLTHWCIYNRSIGFKYLKKVKKLTSRYRNAIYKPYKSQWIRDNLGPIVVGRDYVKKIRLGATGYVESLDQRVSTESKTANEMIPDIRDFIKMHYSYIKNSHYGDWSSPSLYDRFVSEGGRSFGPKQTKRTHEQRYKGYKITKHLDELEIFKTDPRTIGVSEEAYRQLLEMELNQKKLNREISYNRALIVEEISSDLRLSKKPIKEETLLIDLNPETLVSHKDVKFVDDQKLDTKFEHLNQFRKLALSGYYGGLVKAQVINDMRIPITSFRNQLRIFYAHTKTGFPSHLVEARGELLDD
jgi:hypothetical protein